MTITMTYFNHLYKYLFTDHGLTGDNVLPPHNKSGASDKLPIDAYREIILERIKVNRISHFLNSQQTFYVLVSMHIAFNFNNLSSFIFYF